MIRPPTMERVSIAGKSSAFDVSNRMRAADTRTEEIVAEEVSLRVGGGHGPEAVGKDVHEREHDDECARCQLSLVADGHHDTGHKTDQGHHHVQEVEAALENRHSLPRQHRTDPYAKVKRLTWKTKPKKMKTSKTRPASWK